MHVFEKPWRVVVIQNQRIVSPFRKNESLRDNTMIGFESSQSKSSQNFGQTFNDPQKHKRHVDFSFCVASRSCHFWVFFTLGQDPTWLEREKSTDMLKYTTVSNNLFSFDTNGSKFPTSNKTFSIMRGGVMTSDMHPIMPL